MKSFDYILAGVFGFLIISLFIVLCFAWGRNSFFEDCKEIGKIRQDGEIYKCEVSRAD